MTGPDAPQTPEWHSLSAREACSRLVVNGAAGLSQLEASKRLVKYGPNLVGRQKAEPLWEEFLEEARQPIIVLLFVTGILYAVFGGLEDALVIVGVIITLVGVEVVNESRAGKAIASLRRLAEPVALVQRDGGWNETRTDEVVPGDVVLLQAGRRVPADARLMDAHSLLADESSLSGESTPADKSAEAILPGSTPLAERSNMVFAGTTIVRGKGAAVVVATGSSSELGRIGRLTSEVEAPPTLLQRTMGELTRWMVWVALGFSAVVPLLGWSLVHQPPQQMILTGLSLAFATIPEELPIIVTMVLALGAYRLSKKRAIVRHLQAVETLGAVTTIAADKTGTLTENRMELVRVYPGYGAGRILHVGVVCNDAAADGGEFAGDPIEVALLKAAVKDGMDVRSVRGAYPLRAEFTFDNTRKMMSVVCVRPPGFWVGVKGATEKILSNSTRRLGKDQERSLTEQERKEILSLENQMAAEGLRVIAFAEKAIRGDGISQEVAENDLVFVGMAGFADPPRPEVKEAVKASRAAGIRTLMVTGDHPLTAISIAEQVGLDGRSGVLTGAQIDSSSDSELADAVRRTSIFARTTPENKLRIVKALHSVGEVVAVTGDGINDAPALAASDIGIAMGRRGTDVAREAADIVLSDDDYSTIVHSVAEGRTLFSNLTKGVRYYLACKVALILVTLLPVLLLVPVPFAPIQIVLMELFMDLAASATFVAEPAESDAMKKGPRDPKAKFLDRGMVLSIFRSAAGLFLAVTFAYLLTWYGSHDITRAQTVAFASWLIGHIFLALNMRSESEPILRVGLFSNKLMVVWALATILFTALSTSVPGAEAAFKTVPLTFNDWAMLIPLALAGTFWLEARKWLSRAPSEVIQGIRS